MSAKYKIYAAGFITLFGLGGLGFLILVFFHQQTPPQILVDYTHDLELQLLVGFVYGCIAGGLLVALLHHQFFHQTCLYFGNLLQHFQVETWAIVLLSVCAGIGEELLFRGALQPWLGILPTTILFIVLHGYFNPKNKPLFVYGLCLAIVCIGFGYLMQLSGLWAAAMAHCIIDIILMVYLKKTANRLLPF